jgi:putative inorganic carbon (HCO3(-)) transporter
VRALVLVIGLVLGLGMTLTEPFAGVLIWEWFTLQNPHDEAYGIVHSLPINFVIAIVTLGTLAFSRERKLPPVTLISVLMLGFVAWMTFNSFFAFDPSWSWPLWSRTWKTFAFGLVVAATATSRERLYSAAWVAVISLFYYGAKGGLFTILTGGNFHVFGPPGTIIGDNNQLAVALLMALPLADFLRSEARNKWIARGLVAGMGLTVIAIVGTYSRGAVVGLVILAAFMLTRTRKKLVYICLASIVFVFILSFMPSSFFTRMHSISNASDDASFTGRLMAWQVAIRYATDHFPFGAGFYGPQLGAIFHAYFPGEMIHAAHSIYFQVLGEHGYIGFALYILLILAAFLLNLQIIRRARRQPEFGWARNLAVALQASLLVFCVSGALLSMAYYDLFVIEIAMLIPLAEIVRPQRKRSFVMAEQSETSTGAVRTVPMPFPAET